MFNINVDPNKRKEALDKIEQDRIKFEEEYKLRVLNSYKRDVDKLINELEIGYDIKIKDAYERGDSFCEVLFEDDNLLPRIDKIEAINNHELFDKVFPPFISKISDYVSSFICYDRLTTRIMERYDTPSRIARIKADDYCSGITFYFKEL
ncbi:MAG: hypothetical protein ACRCXT_04410 [Paraclostridium sp.]